MVQPLAISVISPMDTSIACDAERPSLSDMRLLCNIKADLMGEYLVDVSLKSLKSVLWNSLYVQGNDQSETGGFFGCVHVSLTVN